MRCEIYKPINGVIQQNSYAVYMNGCYLNKFGILISCPLAVNNIDTEFITRRDAVRTLKKFFTKMKYIIK